MTDVLDTLGSVLNIGGILVALFGLLVESRQRRWSVLGERGEKVAHWLRRIWRKVRRTQPHSVHVTGTGIGVAIGGTGFVTVLRPVNPEDPLPVVLEALQHNMRELVRSSESKQEWHRERMSQGIEVLSKRIAATGARMVEEAEKDKVIAARSLRLEVWGLAVALLGTGFSSLASLLR